MFFLQPLIEIKALSLKDSEVICIESLALQMLVDRVVNYLKEQHSIYENKWITTDQAMCQLNITSKTTLQKLRDQGKIRFTQPMKKNVLYDRDSILEYLENHSKNTF
ncbi:MAG: DNA-binding protein [Bacteroidota bacterium]|nr:DNA-binding protein [Bacteroidota bacterium]